MFGSTLPYPVSPGGGPLHPPRPRFHCELSFEEERAAVWAMTPEQRVAAMYRGELTIQQLCAWASRFPEQIARLNNEFIFIAAFTPEVAEADDAKPAPGAPSGRHPQP